MEQDIGFIIHENPVEENPGKRFEEARNVSSEETLEEKLYQLLEQVDYKLDLLLSMKEE